MMLSRTAYSTISVIFLSLLAGCSDGGMQDVKQWMADVKAHTSVTIPKLAEPKTFVPFTYTQRDAIDPFNQTKLTIALAKLQANTRSALAPDLKRTHEPLESFPLDSILMVGAIRDRHGKPHAILQVDKTVFDVVAGNHLGQNDGEIKAITETEVAITERVQDASDEWVERKTTLELQETKK